jgi:hypothetical protein
MSTPIGSTYDWRCFRCAAVASTERRGNVVDLPKGWVCAPDGKTLCTRCRVVPR